MTPEDYIQIHFGGVLSRSESGWVNFGCPLCGDTEGRMGFNRKTAAVACFKCGYGRREATGYRSFWKLVEDTGHVSNKAAKSMVQFSKEAVGQKVGSPGVKLSGNKNWLKDSLDIFTSDHPNRNAALRYLIRRGLGPSQITRYGIRMKKDGTRVLLPVIERRVVVFCTGRSIVPETEPRYHDKVIPGLPRKKKEVLLNLNLFDRGKHRGIVLVEGPFDAYAVQAVLETFDMGYVGCCGFGKSLSVEQRDRILDARVREVVILHDGTGVSSADKAQVRNLLSPHCRVFVNQYPKQMKDPDEAPPLLTRDLIQQAQTIRGKLGWFRKALNSSLRRRP